MTGVRSSLLGGSPAGQFSGAFSRSRQSSIWRREGYRNVIARGLSATLGAPSRILRKFPSGGICGLMGPAHPRGKGVEAAARSGSLSCDPVLAWPLRDTTRLGRSYGLDQLIRGWFACGTTIIVDDDAVVTSEGDY